MSKVYLKVFKSNGVVEFNDSNNSLIPNPSKIIPSLEMIKNAERSLGGKMHVDVIATKKILRIVFDILSDDELHSVLDVFEINKDKDDISPVGHKVWYFDLPENDYKMFFVDEATFEPYVVEEGIKWRDVNINLVEI